MFNLNLKFQSTRLKDGHTYVFIYPADSEPGIAMLAFSAVLEEWGVNSVACTTMLLRMVGKYNGECESQIESYIEGRSEDYGRQEEQG